jgi:hypothetical protein
MSDQADDLPAGRIGYRLKYISSHKMKPFGCKIVQTGRPTKIFYICTAPNSGCPCSAGTAAISSLKLYSLLYMPQWIMDLIK